MDKQKILEHLNRMLEQEHACAIRYATHAAVVSGPYAEAVAARLREIGNDELLHAENLRERIVALKGTPSMRVAFDELRAATTLEEIVSINIEEEKKAIASYTDILHQIPKDYVILYKTIEEILRDEEEHAEELENLQVT